MPPYRSDAVFMPPQRLQGRRTVAPCCSDTAVPHRRTVVLQYCGAAVPLHPLSRPNVP